MAAAAGPQTPQRPLPGAFTITPAPQGQTIFAAHAASLRQNAQPQVVQSSGTANATQQESHVERAAKTVNAALDGDQKYPALEDYITQGISGEYHLPTGQAWLPFQKLKMHDLPPRLLEQANHASMDNQMGVFPTLTHAWVALDNCLYLWDYTLPNPEIIGWEENAQPITAVKLVRPKPGVFVADIKHLIVVCTATEMLLLGVAAQTTSTGAQTVALYNTRMAIPVRGIGVQSINASEQTGRIFFTGSASEDIYEFQYQQDEGWFRGKTSRICHTKATMSFVPENLMVVGTIFGSPAKITHVTQMVIDDSRNLMYTLNTASEIKVYLIKDRLELALRRALSGLLQNTGHFNHRTELLTARDVKLVGISAIPRAEAGKIALVATTSTGCRLYLSLTRGYGYDASADNPPSSAQILHIRYPPKDPAAPRPSVQSNQTTAMTPYGQQPEQVDTNSRYLDGIHNALRFSPGYWMAFAEDPIDPQRKDRVFVTSIDTARMANQTGAAAATKYAEYGQWISLPSTLAQVMPMGKPFQANGVPLGFGNEIAVQFDEESSEFAIVTMAGVQIIRRRRLVDVFAAMLKYGSTDEEGVEGDIKRFVRTYGRTETSATALAVACGQGIDVAENRVATITEPEVLEKARKAYIEHGGRPDYNANVDSGDNPTNAVRASARHDGTAFYIARIVRSIWKQPIIKEIAKAGAGVQLASTISVDKLKKIQLSLTSLRDFLERNKSFIEGLAGPQAMTRASSRAEEIATQGEHQYMHGLLQLVNSISEGISFVLMLFDEKLEEILAILQDDSRRKVRELTFESLFTTAAGKELAKELVKAIVNRNIANGSNVDSVAEGLRRRCGSFCSADDVIIFKALEQIKKAEEKGAQSEDARQLLNQSIKLFQKIAASLSYENVRVAIESYYRMAFYAGAIQLCLTVALEQDKSKRALAWTRDGKPVNDEREACYNTRLQYYGLVFQTIKQLETDTKNEPEVVDGRYSIAMKRRSEAYDIIDHSDDTVFLTDLYDWYCNSAEGGLNQPQRLLEIDNPHVVEYLKKKAVEFRGHADLLWRYFAHHNDYLQAADVQLDIARSSFQSLNLEDRISYLSRARTNASTRQTILTDSRQNKQKLLREISDLLEIATVQDELLQRIRSESRLNAESRIRHIDILNGSILAVEELYNQYADAANYHDLCIVLYQVADHRNPADIRSSWSALIQQTNDEAPAFYGNARAPWEAVGDKVRELGRRLHTSSATFPVQTLLSMLEKYAYEQPEQRRPPINWAVDVFLDLDMPHETLLPALEQLYYSNEHPFVGSKRKIVASKMVYLLQKWLEASEGSGERVLFGNEENEETVRQCVDSLVRGDLEARWRQAADGIRQRLNDN
ncbi:hypothetical protein DOTSEDRAFT_75834 [Dothistroma septosporum NZE10]|uniref:Uncharacterized protein n=1 Tax=Dothistroma septosporum (strain NZE10 / CBS 128990) TaxID=675120 RepID=N1PCA2_DOTSN|nr:hypothetical protein DOTSEDRAFT_75834 [Dothistroma septosporum NZE10]